MRGKFWRTEELLACHEGFCSVELLWTDITNLCVTKLRCSLHFFLCILLAYFAVLQIGKSLIRSQLMSLEFFIDIILPIALRPLGRLSLFQKWVPGAFPGGKSGRCIRLTTLPPSCAVVMKSGNLNFLEPSGPLQACNGTYLPFYSLITLLPYLLSVWRKGISVSIVITLRKVRGSVSLRGKEFPGLHGVQNGSGAHPTSCFGGTVFSFNGGMGGGGVGITAVIRSYLTQSCAEFKNEWILTSFPWHVSCRCQWARYL